MKFSLPSEQAILKAVHGATGTGVVEQGISVADLIEKFAAQTNYKSGVKEKVIEVVNRRFGGDLNAAQESRLLRYSSLKV